MDKGIRRALAALLALSTHSACSLLFESSPPAQDRDAGEGLIDASVADELCAPPDDLLVRASFDQVDSVGFEFATAEEPSVILNGLEATPSEAPCEGGIRMIEQEGQISLAHVAEMELDEAMIRVVFATPEVLDSQQALFDKDDGGPGTGDVSLDLLSVPEGLYRVVLRLQDGQEQGGSVGVFLCSSPLPAGIYEARAFVGGSKPAALAVRSWNGLAWEAFEEGLDTSPIVIYSAARTCGYAAATGFIQTTSLVDNLHSISLGSHYYIAPATMLFGGVLLDFSLHSSRASE